MPRLLAAQRQRSHSSASRTTAVTHLSLDHLYAPLGHRQPETRKFVTAVTTTVSSTNVPRAAMSIAHIAMR